MTVMLSSHAGLSRPTSRCCSSSSGFLPVGTAAAWANPKERWVLMCRGIFCDMNTGGLQFSCQPQMVFAKNRNRTDKNMKSEKQYQALTESLQFLPCVPQYHFMNNLPSTLPCSIIFINVHIYSFFFSNWTKTHGHETQGPSCSCLNAFS